MKLLSWNVRGLGNPCIFHILHTLVQDHCPEVIFLTETRAYRQRLEDLRVKLGCVGKLVVERVGRSGGLALLWTDKVDISLLSYSRFHIDVAIAGLGKNWRFTGFYGHPESSQRIHSWTLLRRLCSLSSLPWLCGGDFNEILQSSEKLGGLPRPTYLMQNFRNAIDDCGLSGIQFKGPHFTWCNGQDRSLFI